MRRAISRRLAPAVTALCLAASAWAAGTTTVDAQTTEEDTAEYLNAQDLTAEVIVDLVGLDLIGQTPATPTSPAVIHLHVADELRTAGLLRARLYAPVTTRDELLASVYRPYDSPPTPLITEWIVEDAHMLTRDDQGFIFSVPIQPPEVDLTSPTFIDDGRPLPLHLEAVDASGAVVGRLATFLTPGADAAVDGPALPLTIAVVLDLRLPPAHLADGGVAMDEASLSRVLGLAEVLIERGEVPLSVAISPETLDALALIGDDTSVAVLRTALHGRQLLATTWTSLDINDFTRTRALRVDVFLDGLRRGAEALRWVDLDAGTVLHSDFPPTTRAVRAVTGPAYGVSAFVSNALFTDNGPFPPVTLLADPSGESHPLAQADPVLAGMLQFPDTELGLQWARAELLRIAAASSPKAVVVSVSAHVGPSFDLQEFSTSRRSPLETENGPIVPLQVLLTGRVWQLGLHGAAIEPAPLAQLLDMVTNHAALRPATVDDVLAQEPAVGAVTVAMADRPLNPGDFGLYLARLYQVEQRLEAYESFLGSDPFLADPLRTLLAVSASKHLTTGERTEFLNAVEQQLTQGTAGVEFVGRGPITVVEHNAALPVTLINNQPAPVRVALELTSDRINLKQGERPVFTLEPGRNDLSVPVEATASGRTEIRVTVTTPDEAGAIVLATGTFSVRFTDAEGLGFLILVLASAVLAAWWLHTLRRRSPDADMGGDTVAASAPAGGDAET